MYANKKFAEIIRISSFFFFFPLSRCFLTSTLNMRKFNTVIYSGVSSPWLHYNQQLNQIRLQNIMLVNVDVDVSLCL